MKIAVTSVIDLERCAHNRLHEFLIHLAPRHDVTVFSIQDWWKGSQVDASLYADGLSSLFDRIEIIPYTDRRVSPVLQEAAGALGAKRLIRSHGGTFDAHFDYNTLLSGASFGAAFHRSGVPTVYDLADDLVEMVRQSPQIASPFRRVAAGFGQRALSSNIARARFVTVINNALAEDARVDAEKLRILPNGVDTSAFTPEGPSATIDPRLEGSFVLGYVGVLREWVDFEPVLEALAHLQKAPLAQPVKLLIIGEEGGKDRVVRAARKWGVEEDIVFAGTVPYGRVPAYLRSIHCGLIPFDPGRIGANSLPLKLFEYMAVGKPVISTPLQGVRECAGERVSYASNAAQYAEAIRAVAEGTAATAQDNLRWVRENYSWAAAGRTLESVLRAAVGGA